MWAIGKCNLCFFMMVGIRQSLVRTASWNNERQGLLRSYDNRYSSVRCATHSCRLPLDTQHIYQQVHELTGTISGAIPSETRMPDAPKVDCYCVEETTEMVDVARSMMLISKYYLQWFCILCKYNSVLLLL